MPKGGAKSKEKPCNLCDEAIKLSKDSTYLQCPHCNEMVHIACARTHQVVAPNGFYYCQNHQRQMPKHHKRIPSTQNVRFSDHSNFQPFNAEPSLNETNIQSNFTAAKETLLNMSNRTASRPIVNTIPATLPTQRSVFDTQLLNISGYNRGSYNASRRMPNAFDTDFPLTNECCQVCGNVALLGKFFRCKNCKNYYHDNCITGIDRMGEINGSWACDKCVTQKYHKKADDIFARDNSNFFQELEKCRFNNNNQNQHSNNSQSELISESLYNEAANFLPEGKYTNVRHNPEPSQNATIQINRQNQLMEEMLQTLRAMSIQSRQNSKEPPAQSTPTGNRMNYQNTQNAGNRHSNNDIPRTQNQPNQFPTNHTHTPHSNQSLEDYIDESIRRLQFRNEFQSINEYNKQIAQVQLLESRKNASRILPKVKNLGYEWTIFYRTFLSTKQLFSPVENVLRVSEAIECEEIKRLGGINLQTPETLEEALQEINKRVGKPKNLLINEKLKLIESSKLRNNDTKEIINFIESVKKYHSLVEKVGNYSDKADSALLARIFQLLPEKLQSAWLPRYSRIEREEGYVLLGDMTNWLDLQVENYENALSLERLNPYGEIKKKEQKHANSKNENDSKKQIKRKDLLFAQRISSKSHNEYEDSDSKEKLNFTQEQTHKNTNFCWFHDSQHHNSLNCSVLLKKSGEEVSALAREKKICTICNKKSHNGQCPLKNKHYVCIIPGCGKRHSFLFCYMRKGNVQEKSETRKGESRKNSKNISSENKNDPKDQHHCSRNLELTDEDSESSSQEQHLSGAQSYNLLRGSHYSNDSTCSNSMHTVKEIDFDEFLDSPQNKCHTAKVQSASELKSSPNLLSVVVINLFNKGKSLKGAFLLDSGSTISMIDTHAADLLKLNGPNKPLAIAWSGGQSRGDSESKIVKTVAQGIQKRAGKHEIVFRTMQNLNMPKQCFDHNEMKSKYTYLKSLELETYENIIGIIGTDQNWAFRQYKWIQDKSGKSESPAAMLTPLGFSVIGKLSSASELHEKMSKVESMRSMIHVDDSVRMSEIEENELIKMQLSAMGADYLQPFENDRKIADEERAIALLREKVSKVPNSNQYQAPLLWREENIVLPSEESRKLCLTRLNILIKHVSRIGKFDELEKEIENLIQKNYARELTFDEVKNFPNNAYYIPIFISDPKGKRLRLIWDAAAKVNDKSLNDYLLPGPNLYNELINILMRMREGKFLVKADISEMFHQIKIIPEDCPALRFMFKGKNDNKVKYYESNVMIFGSVSSPCTSQFIKNKIADEHKEINHDAAEAIQKLTYVDDLVVSFNNIEYGQNLIRDSRKILNLGGFNLVKLKGNHEEILNKACKEFTHQDLQNPKLLSADQTEKVLGYEINFKDDTMSLCLTMEKVPSNIKNGTAIPTKQQVLKFLMSIYDPLGFFAFYTSKLKLIYHWTCKSKLEWKEYITDQQIPYWNKCIKHLGSLAEIKIPRWYGEAPLNSTKQLIIFGDAGKEMLCSIAYIRIVDEQRRQISYSFIMAKTYTVPIKQRRTIPELELDVAAKNVALMKTLKNGHAIKFDEIYYVTDNACVFHWITNGPHKPSLYVKNRYNKIKAASNTNEWIWLPTDKMVADFGTKFESLPELKYENDWFHPKIFSSSEGDWLNSKPPKEELVEQLNAHFELKPEISRDLHSAGPFDLRQYSKWTKFLRIAQRISHGFINIYKTLEEKNNLSSQSLRTKLGKFVEKDEFYAAELLIIRSVQHRVFSEEIGILSKAKNLPSKFKLKRFLPFIDKKGILRIKTRLPVDCDMQYDKICPIVLPKHHKLTELIILHYHENNHHKDYKTVISLLLQRFFIENIVWTIKRVIRTNCYKCKKRNAKPDTPQMGDLPGYRLAMYTAPFTYTIMDVCGPFMIRVNRRTEKRWLLVFCCLTVRAVHIEILYSMNAQSCLMGLQNMINLRGAPARIISDNGTNFLGASNILEVMQKEWNRKLLEKNVIGRAIEWEFNPAKASHMSGSVERMIGLVKATLRDFQNILEKKLLVPNDEIFHCMICEVIGLQNNVPLTMLPMDPSTNEFLTPNYFLMLRGNFQATTPDRDKFLSGKINQWVEIKELINQLWDHFHKAYVNEILHRDKWIDYKTPLKVGDLVILADPTIANLWRMGVIIEAFPGSNDQVRKLKIRLGKKNPPKIKSLQSKQDILKEYKNEAFIEVTRPANGVAPLNLCAQH